MKTFFRYLQVMAVFSALFFLAPSPGGSTDWKWYYSTVSTQDKSGSALTIREFFDASTIERTQKGSMIFWTKAVLEGDTSGGIDTIVRHIEIYCNENSYRTLKTARFYKNKLVDEFPVTAEKWEGFTPGSSWDAFCEAILKNPD